MLNTQTLPFQDRDPARMHDWFVREVTTMAGGRLTYTPEHADELSRIYGEVMVNRDGVSPAYAHCMARVLYACSPDRILRPPIPGTLRPRDLVNAFLRAFEPWTQFRYDPETMHWWSFSDGQLYDVGEKPTQLVHTVVRLLETLADQKRAEIAALTLEHDTSPTDTADLWKMVKLTEKTAGSSLGVSNFMRDLGEHPLVWTSGRLFNRVEFLTPFTNGVLFTEPVWNNEGLQIAEAGEFRPMASPDYLVTSGARIRWPGPSPREHEAPPLKGVCPTYWSFLRHAFPEAEERETFLRLLGATVFGRRHKMLVSFIGAPNAGKDTVLGWLDLWLGDQVANLSLSTLTEANQNLDVGLWPLRNARVAKVASEVSASGRKLLSDRVKSITNGGSQLLTAAGKYERSASFFFDGPLYVHGNDVPRLTDVDQGIRNRLVAIPFKHSFTGTGDYREAYYRESPMFLWHLYEAFERWKAHGLEVPVAWQLFQEHVVDEASNEYASVDDGVVVGSEMVPVPVFSAAINHLAVAMGLRPRSFIHLGRVFTKCGAPPSKVLDGRRVRMLGYDPDRCGVDPALWKSCWEKAMAEDTMRGVKR